MRNFRDLVVWRHAHKLALELYRATDNFPRHELFGVTSQLRRAGASIPTNLAEACGRNGDGDFGRFVRIAMGSASEVDYLILLAADLGYVTPGEHQKLEQGVTQVRRMLTGLDKRLRRPATEKSVLTANS